MSPQTSKQVIWWLPLGRQPFDKTWDLQHRLVAARGRHELPDLFISVEHPHVITTGRSTRHEHLLGADAPDGSGPVPVFDIERGGDITYHGPGQLVGYFVFHLGDAGRDLHRFLRQVEAVQIRLLEPFGLKGSAVDGKTGVWVDERKVGSVGIAVRRWVSYHGFALNLATDLRFFGLMHPCGFDSGVMTSVSELSGTSASVADALAHVGPSLEGVFGRSVVRVGRKRIQRVLHAPEEVT